MSLSVDLLLAFSLFAFVTSVTPGPNNTMLLASGVNFGFVRSIPHILGISCGFFIMVMAVGFGRGKPLSYWGAAAFQWVNPKAWVMAVGAISTYTPLQGYFTNVVVISTVFALINAPTIGIWAGFGSMLRNVLRDPRWLRVFNVGMALLLVASLYPILAENHSA